MIRKKYIQIYDQTNQKLQIINECLVQLRMINKFFDEQYNIPKDTLNKFPNLDTMLTQSYQPWLDIS